MNEPNFEEVPLDCYGGKHTKPLPMLFKILTGDADLTAALDRSLNQGWLVKNIIPDGTKIIVLYGLPGSFKTSLSIDAVLSISTGISFHNLEVKKNPVLYIAAEGQAGIVKRIAAWISSKGLVDFPDNFSLIPEAIAIDKPENLARLIKSIKKLTKIPKIIVIDTLSRAFSGDENSTADMSGFVNSCDTLSNETGAMILIIHHSGKDATRGARGSIALSGAADVVIRAEKLQSDSVILHCEKMKDSEPFTSMNFEMDKITLMLCDIDGVPLTALVPRLTQKSYDKESTLSGANKIAFASLKKIMLKHGEPIPFNWPKEVIDRCSGSVISEKLWRQAAYDHGISEGELDAKKKAFKRCRTQLLAKDFIGCFQDHYWLN